MGQTVQKSEPIVISRRPVKALRKKCAPVVNLSVYPRSTIVESPTEVSGRAVVFQGKTTEYRKLNSRVAITASAVNDAVLTNSVASYGWLHNIPKNQLTAGILGCLCMGSLMGYQWSSLLNPNQPITTPIKAEKAVVEITVDPKSVDNIPALALPDAPSVSLSELEALRKIELQHIENEKELVAEIDWLTGQNRQLESEVRVLDQETIEQNQDLLELELEIVGLHAQREPPTETRIVYNFVNIPIGAATNSQPDTYVAPATDSNDTAFYRNGEESAESIQAELMSEWEQERAQYNDEGRLVYDPETGFYVNDNYGGETENYYGADKEEYYGGDIDEYDE